MLFVVFFLPKLFHHLEGKALPLALVCFSSRFSTGRAARVKALRKEVSNDFGKDCCYQGMKLWKQSKE